MPEVVSSGEKRDVNITRIIRSFMFENENSPAEAELVEPDETEVVVPVAQLHVCASVSVSDEAFSDESWRFANSRTVSKSLYMSL